MDSDFLIKLSDLEFGLYLITFRVSGVGLIDFIVSQSPIHL